MSIQSSPQNRIDGLFQKKSKEVLTIYFTAGFPKLEDTRRVLKELAEAGTDLIEIGMPFSDPIADGETIQHSNKIALDNGMSIKKLFEQLEGIRREKSLQEVPIVLMGYLNPVLQFGIENFCKRCKEIGIDGLILPDLPLYEFEMTYQPVFKNYGLHTIFLITPQTSEERIKKIDELSNGFVYMVSSNSTTGKTNSSSELSESQSKYFNKIKSLKLQNPRQIGFGISDRDSFQRATKYANGAIIGSAFIRHLESGKPVRDFVEAIVG